MIFFPFFLLYTEEEKKIIILDRLSLVHYKKKFDLLCKTRQNTIQTLYKKELKNGT